MEKNTEDHDKIHESDYRRPRIKFIPRSEKEGQQQRDMGIAVNQSLDWNPQKISQMF